jgi:hypothetical protein
VVCIRRHSPSGEEAVLEADLAVSIARQGLEEVWQRLAGRLAAWVGSRCSILSCLFCRALVTLTLALPSFALLLFPAGAVSLSLEVQLLLVHHPLGSFPGHALVEERMSRDPSAKTVAQTDVRAQPQHGCLFPALGLPILSAAVSARFMGDLKDRTHHLAELRVARST